MLMDFNSCLKKKLQNIKINLLKLNLLNDYIIINQCIHKCFMINLILILDTPFQKVKGLWYLNRILK